MVEAEQNSINKPKKSNDSSSDDFPRVPQTPPTVEVVEIYRLKSFWYHYNTFVIQFNLDNGKYIWQKRVHASQLFSLHLTLISSLSHQLFNFPTELLTKSSQIGGIDEKPVVEAYLTCLLNNENLLTHRKMIEFLEFSPDRFNPVYGHSLKEGWVKIRHIACRMKNSSTDRHHYSKDTFYRMLELFGVIVFGLGFITSLWYFGSVHLQHWGGLLFICLVVLTVVPLYYMIAVLWQYAMRHYRWMVIKPGFIAFYPYSPYQKKINYNNSSANEISVMERSSLIYIENNESHEEFSDLILPSEVILFDSNFRIQNSHFLDNGFRWMIYGVHLSSSNCRVEVDLRNKPCVVDFETSLAKCLSSNLHSSSSSPDLASDEPFLTIQSDERFGSFAPMRPAISNKAMNIATHLIDGQKTFNSIYQDLIRAKYEVFIAGWWLSPDYYLVRGEAQQEKSRLDIVLKELANRGVQIYVLLFKESPLVLTNNSLYTKSSLRSIHPTNVHVIRHPNFLLIPQYWSHHEKIVCIDQKISFLGGLDICLGRYDTCAHPLTDNTEGNFIFPGKDYSNPRIKDFVDVHEPLEDILDRKTQPRMPWHDVSCRVRGPVVLDIARHFIDRWNYIVGKKYQQIIPLEVCCRCIKTGGRGGKKKRKNYTPCLRLRDISSITMELNRSSNTKPRNNSIARPSRWREVNRSAIIEEGEARKEHDDDGNSRYFDEGSGACHMQVVRSLCEWSGGIPITENSIQQAYIQMISQAKHFIYIENQFFVSGFADNPNVSNRVLEALYNRLSLAIDQDEIFRVFILLPLLPAFEGAVTSKDASSLRAVMHWQYQSICRGPSSLIHKLETKLKQIKSLKKYSDYVNFYGLRTHDFISNEGEAVESITEQIYVHSKVMIVDDRKCLIGSANINDRSLLGNRDSEIAVVIEDSEFLPGQKFNKVPFNVGRFCHHLRMSLMKEHLGVKQGDFYGEQMLGDPAQDETWHGYLHQHAIRNTEIYEFFFQCLPSDHVINLKSSLPLAPVPCNDKIGKNKEISSPLPDKLTQMVREQSTNIQQQNVAYLETQSLVNGGWVRVNWRTLKGHIVEDTMMPKIRPPATEDCEDFCQVHTQWQIVKSDIEINGLEHKNEDGWLYNSERNQRVRKWIFSQKSHKKKEKEMETKLCLLLRQPSSSMKLSVEENEQKDDEANMLDLEQIQGNLVIFPLQFLREVKLRPPILPKNIFI